MTKAVLKVSLIVALMALGIQSRAEAVVEMSVRICQGAICQNFGPSPGPGTFTNDNITVGDFIVSGSVSTIENAALSNAATTTISVQRLTTTNAAQGNDLTIWLNAEGYNMPVGPNYTFTDTLSATSSGPTAGANVAFQGWFSDASIIGFPPAGSVSPGSINCALVGTDSCNAPNAVHWCDGCPSIRHHHADDVHHPQRECHRLLHLERPGEHRERPRAGTRFDAASRHRPPGPRALWASPVKQATP